MIERGEAQSTGWPRWLSTVNSPFSFFDNTNSEGGILAKDDSGSVEPSQAASSWIERD